MNDKTRERIATQVLETIQSLNWAIEVAGGESMRLERMKNMTLFQFICHVAAPNNIRFTKIPAKEIND